jgi:hypothetical protein
MTGTPSYTRTATVTATVTPVFSPTPTPTTLQSGSFAVTGIIVYPNPVMNADNTLHLHIDATMPLTSVEMKIYTVSFRKICDITWDAVNISGNYDVSVALDEIGVLSKGIYYYVTFVKNNKGKEAGSKAGEFIVLK